MDIENYADEKQKIRIDDFTAYKARVYKSVVGYAKDNRCKMFHELLDSLAEKDIDTLQFLIENFDVMNVLEARFESSTKADDINEIVDQLQHISWNVR